MLSHVLRKVSFARPPTGPERVRTLCTNGHLWRTLPEGDRLFGPDGPDLAHWIAEGRATIIKSGIQRTIYRVQLPTGTVFVKHSRVHSPRALIREIFRPAKARLEFENAVALRQLGFNTVEPLAWGSRYRFAPGDSLLITRATPAEGTADSVLERMQATLTPHQSAVLRRRVSRELGSLMARMHDAGVAHPDPHPGNLLLGFTEHQRPVLTLIDVHAVRFGQPLSWSESLDNLVLLNRWFQLRSTRADRYRFWTAYCAARTTLRENLESMAQAVEVRTAASNARFWNGRFGRYTTNNRLFRKVARGQVRGYAVRDCDRATIEHLLTNPDAPFADPAAKRLKDSRTSTVVEFTVQTSLGPKQYIYKRFELKTKLIWFKNLFRPSVAVRSWVNGHTLLDRWLTTARPLCVLDRYRYGSATVGYLLTEKVPDALDLPAALQSLHTLPTTQRLLVVREWAAKLGRLLRTMHARDVQHRDLKAANILMQFARSQPEQAEPVLIDLVGMSVGRPSRERLWVRDLARLTVSFLNSTTTTRTDRLRVLRAYQAWALHGPSDWKTTWRNIEAAVHTKVSKNTKTGRPVD